jgi:cation transport ATPase
VRLALRPGAAAPRPVEPGGRAFAGTLLEHGALVVRVAVPSEDTMVQRMARELEHAAERATRPNAADRLAPLFTAATLAIATATLIGWWTLRDGGAALSATVAVLVVACPCALALAHPLSAAAGLGAAARRGLLFRSADALLDLAEVETVALDKTGTVTEGDLEVIGADADVLRVAAGLERFSTHPVARAVTREAAARGIPLPEARDVQERAGEGIAGTVDGRRWRLERGGPGRVDLVDDAGGRRPILLGDRLRSDSARTVARLEAEGLNVVLLTGDHADGAATMGAASGIHTVHSELNPAGKAAWIRAREATGRPVVFVGDGLNDGPALAAARVGVAMGSGAASSILAADGVLASPSIEPLVAALRAARAARSAIRTNLVRSLLYNVTAVAGAAAGLVNPLVAAVLMPLSSGLVVLGASGVERAVRRAEVRDGSAAFPPGRASTTTGRSADRGRVA